MHKTLAAMPRGAQGAQDPDFDDLLWLVSTSVTLREMDEAGSNSTFGVTENLAAFLG